MIYGLAFFIGMLVAGLIWVLFAILKSDNLKKFKNREHYLDLRMLKHKKGA
jgi:hypothetical protein